MHDFLKKRFIIVHVKGVVELFDKIFKRVYGNIWKCVTPFLDVHFKCDNEKPTSNILAVNIMFSEKFKKVRNVLKNDCFTLAIILQIQKVINYSHRHFEICSSGKTFSWLRYWNKPLKIQKVQIDFLGLDYHLALLLAPKMLMVLDLPTFNGSPQYGVPIKPHTV